MDKRDMLIHGRFEHMVKKHPDNIAVIYLGERFTYKKLNKLSLSFAASLMELGIKEGDRIMLYLPNSIQWIIAFLGILKIGAVAVPVSPIYTSYEIRYMLNDSGAETIICQDTNFCYVEDIYDETPLKRIIFTNIAELLPAWKRAIGHLFDKIPDGKVKKGKNVLRFKDLIRTPGTRSLPDASSYVDPEKDLTYILYTGGTTGDPKGVPGNHAGMTSYMEDILGDVVKEHLLEGKDSYICINPLFHIMSLGFFMTIGLSMGNTTVVMPIPQIDAILSAIERYRVRWFLGVPALYRMILENDRLDYYDLSSVKYCFCGGDVLPTEVYRRWKERFHIPIYQVYGSTEAGHVSYSPLDKEPEPMCVGKPLKSRECIVVDPETLSPLKQGEVGELLVHCPYTIKQYWNKPDETARSYVNIYGKTYYRMGDYVRIKDDGQIEYVERSSDIIKYKGYRVSASEIEAVLQDHPAVVGACVIGVPDGKVGERIKAIVVLKEDIKGVEASVLLKWCRERLALYKVPQYIEFRDMLPKSKVGKLLRREIRDEEKRLRV